MRKSIGLMIAWIAALTLVACLGSAGSALAAQPASSATESQIAGAGLYQTMDYSITTYLPLVIGNGSGSVVTTYIVLEGDSISYSGSGAVIDGSVITITDAGSYDVIGALYDGQIIVSAGDEDEVELILHGIAITCTTTSPIFVAGADKTTLTLAANTTSYVTDGAAYVFPNPEEDEPDATIFSKDDLVIDGDGALVVDANYNNGIASKDDLKIKGGVITVTAVNDAIRGRDSLEVKDGTVTVTAGGDGLQSNNDEDAAKGYILIKGGDFNVTSFADGIQAETALTITGGTFDIVTGGGSNNVTTDTAKALKAGVNLSIEDGNFTVDAADDAVHSNNTLSITGGTLEVASSDDAIHAEIALTITNGDINITKCVEGIEATQLTIDDGNIHVVSSDDGINAAGDLTSSPDYFLHINGGYIVVNAAGDGIDVNGSITMSGGVVLVNGPTRNDNGAIDYDFTFVISGGFLVAAGSSGMAQAPSQTSTQYVVKMNFQNTQAANSLFHVETSGGEEILTFKPAKQYQSVIFSMPALANGAGYAIYTGGSHSGAETDGLYAGGAYTPGTQATQFTITGIITNIGGGPPGPGGIVTTRLH